MPLSDWEGAACRRDSWVAGQAGGRKDGREVQTGKDGKEIVQDVQVTEKDGRGIVKGGREIVRGGMGIEKGERGIVEGGLWSVKDEMGIVMDGQGTEKDGRETVVLQPMRIGLDERGADA